MEWSTLTLRPYLYADTLTLRTEHHALKWNLDLAGSSGTLALWRRRLAEYDYEVEYRPCITQNVADEVSHLRRSGDEQNVVNEEVMCFVTESSSSNKVLKTDQ